MKNKSDVYSRFAKWVQDDMSNTRSLVNRKVFGLVLWCLVIPSVLSLLLYGLRRFQILVADRYVDIVLFLPPFLFTLFSLWPTFRRLPRTFRMGGFGAILEESAIEVRWSEETAMRMNQELGFTSSEWSLISFHLSEQIEQARSKNRHLSALVAVVFFFMYQFLDIGGGGEVSRESGVLGILNGWVDQLSQWGSQILGIILFSLLFYLSGLQLQKYLIRYAGCVKRLAMSGKEDA